MTTIDKDLDTITAFINRIGIPCMPAQLEEGTFLPGIDIKQGAILYDKERMKSPGDLLHEAGHVAVLTAEHRKTVSSPDVSGDLQEGGAEMAAIAWSWAALHYLQIVPEIVFHSDGYKGDADNLIYNFSDGKYIGVSLLQWLGMTTDPNSKVQTTDAPPFPKMKFWLRP